MAASAYDQSQRRSSTPVWSSHLLARQTFRFTRHLHALQPNANSARAHKDDLVALLAEADDRLDDRRERRQQWLMRRLMHDRRCPYMQTSVSLPFARSRSQYRALRTELDHNRLGR